MARPATEPPRVRSPWAWGGALILLGMLASGLIGAGVLLWRVIDVEPLLRTADEETPAVVVPVAEVALPALTTTPPWHAHLYRSRLTADFFPDSAYFPSLMARWDSLLSGLGAAVTPIDGAGSIDSLAGGALLVMPSTLCLSKAEREAVRAYRERGGHLLVSWALGARDARCEWVGYDFLREMAAAEAGGTLSDEPPNYVAVPHGGVLGAGLPPGARVELESESWVTLRSPAASAFWSDAALNARPAPGGGYAGGALAQGNGSAGRFAWFGYRVDAGAGERDVQLVRRLAQNAALWAAGHAVAELDPWPYAYRSAMAVTQDVEHSFRNSRRLAQRFKARGTPLTFFVVTQLAVQNSDLARELLAAGEVGSHGPDHRQIAGRMGGTQLAALSRSRADIASWSGELPLGLRPPREIYDRVTLDAWRRLGGLYLAASNGGRSAAPGIFDVEAGRVVVLPRVVDYDYAVMVLRGENSPDSLQASLLGSLEKVRALGGLHLLTLHTQLIDSRRRVAAVESAVQAAERHGDVWLARGAEIADWWLARADIELTLEEAADGQLILTVRNGGEVPVSGATLQLYLPGDPERFAAPEVGEAILESSYTSSGLRLQLPTLGPGTSLEILLPLRAAAAGPADIG